MSDDIQISRRTFLAGSAAAMTGGLVLTYQLGTRLPTVAPPTTELPPEPIGPPGTLNVHIHVRPDDRVELTIPVVEMGQGATTALAQVLADELRARWEQIELRVVPTDPTRMSSSIREHYTPLRKMAAMARLMLQRAAAFRWGVPVSACRVEDGSVIRESTGQSLTFGAVAADASRVKPPEDPPLIAADARTLIGRSVPRWGAEGYLTGETEFGIDVRPPGQPLRYVQVARPPWFGAVVGDWREAAISARSVPLVLDVLKLADDRPAVVATNSWSAETGLRAMELQWKSVSGPRWSDRNLEAALVEQLDDGIVQAEQDDLRRLDGVRRRITAEYRVPFLAQAALEPLTCTVHARADECEIWVGTQNPGRVIEVAARVTQLPPDRITLHVMPIGGSFGRRLMTDFVEEAVQVAVAAKAPVQVRWSREDEMAGGYYRPAAVHRITGVVDGDGWPIGWDHAVSSVRIPAMGPKTDVPFEWSFPYGIRFHRVRRATVEAPIPAGYWRSGEYSHLAFATERFVDELARLGGKDPVEVRRHLFRDQPRHLRALDAAAERAGYGGALPEGRAFGVAVFASYGTVVAQVVEASEERGRPRVHKVTCAVDCGPVVNPDGVLAQMEGSIAFGLSAALYGRLRLRAGRVQESNFHDYRLVRLREMPEVEVMIIPSEAPTGGAGEPGVPPVAAALANALSRVRESPIRRLPLSAS